MTSSSSKGKAPPEQPAKPADAAKPEAASHAPSRDVALVSGRSTDGKGWTILRSREGRIEAGEIRPLESGKPIHGEVIRLKPHKEFPLLCDVETQLCEPRTRDASVGAPRSGPAQVASEQYRRNWESIYQRSTEPELLN